MLFLILLACIALSFATQPTKDLNFDNSFEHKAQTGNEEILLSFIIPVHPSQASVFLRQCVGSLSSVFAQFPSEVIFSLVGQANFKFEKSLQSILGSQSQLKASKIISGTSNEHNSVAALNRGAKGSQGKYLVFVNPSIEMPSVSAMEKLVDVLQDTSIGAVGPKIQFEDGSLYFAGIELILAPLVSDSYWRQNDEMLSVFYRYQGLSSLYEKANIQQDIDGLSRVFMVVRQSIFEAAGGFHTHYTSQLFYDVDLCLSISNTSRIVYVPTATVTYHDSHEAEAEMTYIEDDSKLFHRRWERLVKIVEAKYEIPNMIVAWNMDCGIDGTLGFTMEAHNFIMSIYNRVKVKVEVSLPSNCKRTLEDIGLPNHSKQLMSWFMARSIPNDGVNVVAILHADPGRYTHGLSNARYYSHDGADCVIGRSMFETNSTPEYWVEPCNDEKINQIWVPSHFNLNTFSTSGVDSKKLTVVPESVDTNHFDPQIHDPMYTKSPNTFRFLSILKWEERKAWKILFRSYFDEFCSKNPIQIEYYVLARMRDKDEQEYQEFIKEYKALHINRTCHIPPIKLINEMIPYHTLPSLFLSADGFILASHGEGWGLPLMEAMAMGLPTIGTNWSGNLEFMNSNNSLLVSIDGLEPSPFGQGHHWAKLNQSSLRQHMRTLFEGKAKELGDKAKAHIRKHFGFSAVGDLLMQKFHKLNEQMPELKKNKKISLPNYSNYHRTTAPSPYSYFSSGSTNSYSSGYYPDSSTRVGKFYDADGKELVRIKIN